jgi:DNA repair photolyase
MRRTDNPQNRFEAQSVEWLEEPPYALLEVHEERSKSIVSANDSPDIPFRYSVNPYRGCYHGCWYCYARPSHQYWGFGAGTDFERKIIVKTNAAELLRARFDEDAWSGDPITFSGNTDCYQPLEAAWRLTRACLSVCAEYQNPVAIITKSALIQRDLDVLRALNERARLRVYVSIPFADDAKARLVEPGASAPSKRLAALASLSAAGIETGIAVAPIIVGLNDPDIPELLSRARDAGAKHAFKTAIRLPAEVLPVFESRLAQTFPDAAGKVMSAIVQIRRGKKNESRFGDRMHGCGPRWQVVEDLFALHCQRLGFNDDERESFYDLPTTFRRPRGQLSLF